MDAPSSERHLIPFRRDLPSNEYRKPTIPRLAGTPRKALPPMGRIGEPEDIADVVAFLTSPGSVWITSQTLTVDGGRMGYIDMHSYHCPRRSNP